MRAARTDANHAEVLQALRAFGWTVEDTHAFPRFVDAIAHRPSHGMYLVEIKAGAKQKLKPSQERLRRAGFPFVRFDSASDVEAFTVNPTPKRMRG